MIRLSWCQFRTQAMVAFAVLVAIAIVLGITGLDLSHIYNTSVATCKGRAGCVGVTSAFVGHYQALQNLGHVVVLAPAVIGMFWGAPLVARELEVGTHRMVWTQSIARSRWLAAKVGLMGLAGMAVAGVLSLLVTWWFSPLDRVDGNVFGLLDERGIVPIGYTAFAFALGVTAGMLTRRTLPAMATTLVAFVGARLAVTDLRSSLVAPMHRALPLSPSSVGYSPLNSGLATLTANPPNIPNGWVYSTQIADKHHHALTPEALRSICPQLGSAAPGPSGAGSSIRLPQGFHDCVTRIGVSYHEIVSFQPANRYWMFQWYETVIFVGLALLLVGFCFVWIRHRVA